MIDKNDWYMIDIDVLCLLISYDIMIGIWLIYCDSWALGHLVQIDGVNSVPSDSWSVQLCSSFLGTGKGVGVPQVYPPVI